MRISDWSSDVCSSDLIVEAGEYVLGVLTDAERQDFERRLNQDPELATEVSNWTEHFAAMSRKYEQVPVSAKVWTNVESRSDERRVGTECGSQVRSRRSP